MRFCQDNEQASRAKCEAALRDLSQAVERRVSAGAYSVSGGYELFRRDQQALVEKYQELPGKGVMVGARAGLRVPSPSPHDTVSPPLLFLLLPPLLPWFYRLGLCSRSSSKAGRLWPKPSSTQTAP